ncbi:MAG: hypothetical protein JWQ88_3035, partial [Rhodoferax sp.]|nr:hypothetical protein [Rhodoferax sp.]
LKGAIGVPEAVVGLADIPTGGRVGRALEEVGFRPKEAKAMLDEQYSTGQKEAFQNVQQAEGFGGKFIAALQNPSVISHSVVESLPSMGAGGVVGRGILAAAPRVGGVLAAGAGEGVLGAGSAAEQIRQETPDGLMTPMQSGLALASGAGTMAFGALGNKIAKSLGIHDVDLMLVGASTNPASAKGVVRRVLEGATSEGLLEELPQSVQEQVLQNLALGKDITEGVDQAAVLGLLSGAAMGGGANILGGGHQAQPAPAPVPVPVPPRGSILALSAPTITVGPDGVAQTADNRQGARDSMAARYGGLVEKGPLARAANTAAGVTDVVTKPPGALARAAATQPAPAPVLSPVPEGVTNEGTIDQATADEVGQQLPGASGTQLSANGDAAPAGSGADGSLAPSMLGDEPPITADDVAQHVAGKAADAVAPQVYPTYEEADSYRMEQKRRGTSVQALPSPTDGGFNLAVKGSPEYPAAEQLRDERRTAKERLDAGTLDGDITNKLGKPFTIRLPATVAVKKNPGFEVVEVKGGFVARKAAAAPATESAPIPAAAPAPVPLKPKGGQDNAPAYVKPAQAAVQQEMSGEITRAQLHQRFADLNMEQGDIRSVVNAIAWNVGDTNAVHALRHPAPPAPAASAAPAAPAAPAPAKRVPYTVEDYTAGAAALPIGTIVSHHIHAASVTGRVESIGNAEGDAPQIVLRMQDDGKDRRDGGRGSQALMHIALRDGRLESEGAGGAEGEPYVWTVRQPAPGPDATKKVAVEAEVQAVLKSRGKSNASGQGGEDVAQIRQAATARLAKPKPADEAKALADYFTPGNIVKSYSGHDEVLGYTPGVGSQPMSVEVHAVEKKGDKWVRVGKAHDARWHRTMPDAHNLAAGPVAKVAQDDAIAPRAAAPLYSQQAVARESAAAITAWAE